MSQICRIREKYPLIKCGHKSWEKDPDGLCILHSLEQNKNIGLFEKEVKLKVNHGDYNFQHVWFPIKYYFNGITFEKKVDFQEAIFSEEMFFIKTIFLEEVIFDGARFLKTVDFNRAKFKKEVSFIKSSFLSEVYFVASEFEYRVDFSWTTFEKESLFHWASFSGESIFNFAVINGNVILASINLPSNTGFKPDFAADFRSLTFGINGSLEFKDLSLALVQFSETDLRLVKFFKVNWYQAYGRNMVYDEVTLKKNKAFDLVERLYRFLKLNYEKEGDYKKVGDFHYGEMEMHRRANPEQLWYQFYWALSGYGEKPLRALVALIVMLFGCTGLLLLVEPNLFGTSLLDSLSNAILYVFQKGTLQRPDLPKQAEIAAQVVGAIIPVIIPGQIALFFLALRNRLGRRR